jgi:hypothetical protein
MPETEFPPLLRLRAQDRPLAIRILLVLAAVVSFVAGVFGWLIPVVTGIPFYVLGLILLAMASPGAGRWINRQEARLTPRWRRRLRQGLAKIPFRGIRKNLRTSPGPSSRP